MSEQPVIEVHYIKQGDELRSQYIDQDPVNQLIIFSNNISILI